MAVIFHVVIFSYNKVVVYLCALLQKNANVTVSPNLSISILAGLVYYLLKMKDLNKMQN